MACIPLEKIDLFHFHFYSQKITFVSGEECICEDSLGLPGLLQPRSWFFPPQMLLEKLNGTVPCLLDTSTIPAEELTMSPSRSVANPGLGESLATSTPRPSNGDSPFHPYHRTFSPHFHHFVEQCLQRNPDARYPLAWGRGWGCRGTAGVGAGFERMRLSKGLGSQKECGAPQQEGPASYSEACLSGSGCHVLVS